MKKVETISIPCELYFYSIPEIVKEIREEYAENCINNLKRKKECITGCIGIPKTDFDFRKFHPGEELEARYDYLMRDNLKFKDTYNYFSKKRNPKKPEVSA